MGRSSARRAAEPEQTLGPIRLPQDYYDREEGIYWGSRGPTFDPVDATLHAATLEHGIERESLHLAEHRSGAPQVSRMCHSSEGTGSIAFPVQGNVLDDDDHPTPAFMAAASAAASTLRALELRDEMLGDHGVMEGLPDRLRDSWQFRVHRLVALLLRSGLSIGGRRTMLNIDPKYRKGSIGYRPPGIYEFKGGYSTGVHTSHVGQGSTLWSFRLHGLYAYAGTVTLGGPCDLQMQDDEEGTSLSFRMKQDIPETILNSLTGRDVSAAIAIPHLNGRRLGIDITGVERAEDGSGNRVYRILLDDVVDVLAKPRAPHHTEWMPPHRPGLRGR